MSVDDTGGTGDLAGHVRSESVTMASLARDCLALLPADKVVVTLMAGGRGEAASASSNGSSAGALELELTLGEGPATDAYASGLPVVVADLALVGGRWPQYVRAADVAGVQAVYAFPLHIGAAKLGVVTLYRLAPHELTDAEVVACLSVAESLAQALVDLQSGARNGALAGALEGGAQFRSVVHQATGALASRLGCSLEDALIRLRGTAFAAERSLSDVAVDVVAGRLTIEGP